MLVNCPECELQVSDKAISCPHCGLPFKQQVKRKYNNKRKRLPNGFGQISEITSGNLRNRFRVMVSVGKRSDGRPIVRMLKPQAYFNTYNEAYEALVEYNKNPYDLDDDITVYQLYERWTDEYFKSLSSISSIRTITSAWVYCSSVYDMRVKDIRARHIKGCMEYGTAKYNNEERKTTPNTKARIKSLFNLMLDYALEYELVDVNYARTFNLSKNIIEDKQKACKGHHIFTKQEIDTLWDNVDEVPYVNIILIQCYSGWRPQELGLIKLENVDLNRNIIIGGMKTEAGKNRIVPIHPKIRPLIVQKYNEAVNLNSKYLINCIDGTTHKDSIKFTYDKYRHRFDAICKRLNLNDEHRPHDGRKHFISMAKKYNVDEYAIKYIVGHSINDITEKVYTDRNIEWLKVEMEKIK